MREKVMSDTLVETTRLNIIFFSSGHGHSPKSKLFVVHVFAANFSKCTVTKNLTKNIKIGCISLKKLHVHDYFENTVVKKDISLLEGITKKCLFFPN